MGYPQQGADIHVFTGLGHNAFVGGDHHGHQVDAGSPGHHVLNEFFVAGNVDDPDQLIARQPQGGKAQVNGDAAALFLLQPIGIGSGQRLDKTRLAVIDMTGCAQNKLIQENSLFIRPPAAEILENIGQEDQQYSNTDGGCPS